jgi:cation-transporting ATPase 13A2
MTPARDRDIRAADEYQAPSWGKAIQKQQENVDAGLSSSPISTSPFFTDKESEEAMKWARSRQAEDTEVAVDDEPLDTDEGSQNGIRIGRRRRDSQVGSYDEQGTIFDGPSAGVVPSSVSR